MLAILSIQVSQQIPKSDQRHVGPIERYLNDTLKAQKSASGGQGPIWSNGGIGNPLDSNIVSFAAIYI